MSAISKDLLEKFKTMDTTSVSDALDRLGIKGGCQGIVPRVPRTKAVGTAFTVRYRPCGVVKGTVGDFMEDVQPGQVIVIDNGGRTYGTVWGDIMTVYAQKRGIAGTVIDGVCRDLPRILECKYPIFTRGGYMVTGKDRVEVDGINIPVAISDVQVRPNDLVMCDDSGVLIVPLDHAEAVLKVAVEVDEAEQKILELLDKGMTLTEARKQMGYHKLQSKQSK
jgi:4-hydroxy-4-methyl-2-oxoglutarate aldolase